MKIAVDFDGTIVTHAYPQIGKPIPFAIETLKKLQREDMCQIILYTCREGQLLDDAVNYCKERGLEFYAVNAAFPEETPDMRIARKLDADVFIDDHNLGGLPDWGVIYQMIHSGKALQPAEHHFDDEKSQRKQSLLQRLFS